MSRLSSPLRFIALLLAALHLASRPAAMWEDARLAAAAVRAAADGSLVHAEDDRRAECVRVHAADCELCRLVATSEQRSAPVASGPAPASRDVARMPRTADAPAAPAAGPESARPPPLA